jgi:hypothetical protein
MRAKITYFLVIFLLLPIALAACSSNGGGEVPICNPEDEPFTQAEKEAFWAENGIWRATTLEEASEVAGFEVVSFGSIPEGLCRSLYISVEDRCVTLSEFFDCDLPIQVTQYWGLLEYESLEPGQLAFLMLMQSPGNLGAGGTPTEVGGYPATRDYQVAQDDRPAMLSLHWEIDGMNFMLAGTISGPITEELIYEVAASIEMD